MWGKLLSETYQKVRTKADEVREQVSSAVQAQQATITRARDALLSLGGVTEASRTKFLSRGGAEAFAAGAAAAHLSAEDIQRLLQREAGEIRTVEDARDMFTTWRQLILQSGLHGSPRFISFPGEQEEEEEAKDVLQQQQQYRRSDSSSSRRKEETEVTATATREESEERSRFQPGLDDVEKTPGIKKKDEKQLHAEDEQSQQDKDISTPLPGSGGSPETSDIFRNKYGIVSIPAPTPPTFAAALEEEAARGERNCFAEGFSFKEIFLRSTALERALLSLAKKETLRLFFAAHAQELLLATRKQQQQQQHPSAAGCGVVIAAGAAAGDAASGQKTAAAATAGDEKEGFVTTGHNTKSLFGCTDTSDGIAGTVMSSSPLLHERDLSSGVHTAETAEAATTASPSSQASSQGISSNNIETEEGSLSTDKQRRLQHGLDEEQQYNYQSKLIYSSSSSSAAAEQQQEQRENTPEEEKEKEKEEEEVKNTLCISPPPAVSALLALLSLCSPGTQEQHLLLLHALFTVAAAAASASSSSSAQITAGTNLAEQQQRQLVGEVHALRNQRLNNNLLLLRGDHSKHPQRMQEQQQQQQQSQQQHHIERQQQENEEGQSEGTEGQHEYHRRGEQQESRGLQQQCDDNEEEQREQQHDSSCYKRDDREEVNEEGENTVLDSLAAAVVVAEQQQQQQQDEDNTMEKMKWKSREGRRTSSSSFVVVPPPSSSSLSSFFFSSSLSLSRNLSISSQSTTMKQQAFAAIERMLLLFSLWKRAWLLERREDARRRLEEEGRRLAAKIEGCDLPVDGVDHAIPSNPTIDASTDPLISHNIRLLANAQLLRLQQQVLMLKEDLLRQQRAAATEKIRILKDWKQKWKAQDAAAAAARHNAWAEQDIQEQMAQASEMFVKEAGLVEERRVALHQKLKSLKEKKILLEQQLADCVQTIATAEREQQKLLYEEEHVHSELLHVQLQYKQQVQQHHQQQQQQLQLQQALEELDATATGLAEYLAFDIERRETATAVDIQRLQGALQTQVCRHFAFEKTRLQQQVHLLQEHVRVLDQLFQQQDKQERCGERMGEEQQLQLMHARKLFIRATHQLDVMYSETLSFTEQHRHILSLAIRQQGQNIRSKVLQQQQQQQQQQEKEENEEHHNDNQRTAPGMMKKDTIRQREEEQCKEVDPMKDISIIYATLKKQLAPYITRLAATAAEARTVKEIRNLPSGSTAPIAEGQAVAALRAAGQKDSAARDVTHAEKEGELRIRQQQQQHQREQQQQHEREQQQQQQREQQQQQQREQQQHQREQQQRLQQQQQQQQLQQQQQQLQQQQEQFQQQQQRQLQKQQGSLQEQEPHEQLEAVPQVGVQQEQQVTGGRITSHAGIAGLSHGVSSEKEEEGQYRWDDRTAKRVMPPSVAGEVPLLIENIGTTSNMLQHKQLPALHAQEQAPRLSSSSQQQQHVPTHRQYVQQPSSQYDSIQQQQQVPQLRRPQHSREGGEQLQNYPAEQETVKQEAPVQRFELTTPPGSPTASPRIKENTEQVLLPAAAQQQHEGLRQQQNSDITREQQRSGSTHILPPISNGAGSGAPQVLQRQQQQQQQQVQQQHVINTDAAQQLVRDQPLQWHVNTNPQGSSFILPDGQQPQSVNNWRQQQQQHHGQNILQPPVSLQTKREEQTEVEEPEDSWLL